MPIAMYPGSFDPVTRGHLDIIKRSSRMFDTLIVAVLNNSAKTPLFTVKEREEMLRECCKDIPNVKVMSFDGLTVNFAQQQHATVMVRGLRAVTDFENEIQLAHTNHALYPGIETVFLRQGRNLTPIAAQASRYSGVIRQGLVLTASQPLASSRLSGVGTSAV